MFCSVLCVPIQVSRPNEMDCILFPDLPVCIHPVYRGCAPGFCKVALDTISLDCNNIAHICEDGFISKTKYRQYIFGIMDTFVAKNSKGNLRCKSR